MATTPPTAPKLSPDEEPLDPKTLRQFLASMSGEMVLVGGQALAFWMQRFGIRSEGAAISNDGDALGPVREAVRIARQLEAALQLPRPTDLTSLVAQIRIPVRDGKVRNIDVLHLLYTTSGLRKSHEFTRRVQQDAVQVELEAGIVIRVMHPLDVLESRAYNAVGLLEDKGPHVVTQAAWAIEVAREALQRAAAAQDFPGERVGSLVQRVYKLWSSSVGKRLEAEHGLRLLDALDLAALRAARPELGPQLDRIAQVR